MRNSVRKWLEFFFFFWVHLTDVSTKSEIEHSNQGNLELSCVGTK